MNIIENLVHIIKIGAKGDSEKLRIQVMRLIRSLKNEGNPLYKELHKAVFEEDQKHNISSETITRISKSGISQPVPIDSETGAELLLVDDPPRLSHGFISVQEIEMAISAIITERKNLKKLANLNLKPITTILFTGAPGVGKTMAAKKIALDLRLPLLTLDLATVISSFLGRTGNNLKKVLEYARNRPCVILLDEIDAIAKKRDDSSDIGELKRLVTVILQELDLWPEHNLLIAATNHYDLLDTAVSRRFDTIIHFPNPKSEELVRLGRSVISKQENIPIAWIKIIARIMDKASFSDFLREVNKVRKAYVIGGESSAVDTLANIIKQHISNLDTQHKKDIAIQLLHEAKLTQRFTSKITGLHRDTIRKAVAS